ncbi:MAG: endonuclease/exonuclease/phosphatase family protein [Actinomycetota bacterium]|uniref:endonuclease/exonuclease/phosphatase family protein n=1 Tax=Paenarthrobacter sp. PH39-S1 TaxID=3046204 RepID=UPI0024B99BF6|nr:endonuclease/exonuclease/phosphatase family protein [Paenarthrobacter sp. PH39-S1]MDJ0355391.1 endonuclease/exonuclease/phosphatase family protein [Paenarthrobacter sp. PH39-S1]MDQ6740352.1 endonuclease/exonuclease/phosphatase family protein [Actinomycetota bacterium]
MKRQTTAALPKAARRRRAASWTAVAILLGLPAVLLTLVRLVPDDLGTPWVQLVTFTPYSPLPLTVAAAGAWMTFRRSRAAFHRVLAGIFAATLVLQLCWLVPRFVAHPVSTAGPFLTVMSINARDAKASPEDIVASVRRYKVDVLVVVDLNRYLARDLRNAGLSLELPQSDVRPVPGGSGLYSRFPLRHEDAPVPEDNSLRQATVLVENGGSTIPVLFSAVHITSPRPHQTDEWARTYRLVRDAARPGTPQVMLGDFNSTIDHAGFRDLLAAGFTDAGSGTGQALVPTWPFGAVVPPFATIDHVLSSPDLPPAWYTTEPIGGSDHAAVLARLSLADG